MMIMRFFSDFLYKGICCGYSFKLHRQVDAIQMSTHNICLYKDVKKKYTGCNLKSTEFLDCALIGVCAVIRSNTVTGTIKSRYASFCLELPTPRWIADQGLRAPSTLDIATQIQLKAIQKQQLKCLMYVSKMISAKV